MAASKLVALQKQGQEEGWLLQTSEIELGSSIGTGGTAEIFRAQLRGKEVAVKCLLPKHMQADPAGLMSFLQEVELLARLRHPNILRLEGACLDPPQHCWLVTELLSSGTLGEYLHGGKGRHFRRAAHHLPPLAARLEIALEVALGMQYMHEQTPKIIHRDLKPSNIFVGGDLRVCIADFGYARTISPADGVLTKETGTYLYMAPEVMRSEHYDEKCDVYSFGVLLNELVTGEHPYIETYFTPGQIAQCVALNSIRPALPRGHHGAPKQLETLIQACWAHHPKDRPSAAQITLSLGEVLAEEKRAEAMDKAAGHHHGPHKTGIEGFFSSMMTFHPTT